jgi:protein TonB
VTFRLALALPLSIGLHAAVVTVFLMLAPPFDADSALFIDLTLPEVSGISAPAQDRPAASPSPPRARGGHAPPGHTHASSRVSGMIARPGVTTPATPALPGGRIGTEVVPTIKPEPDPLRDVAPDAPPPAIVSDDASARSSASVAASIPSAPGGGASTGVSRLDVDVSGPRGTGPPRTSGAEAGLGRDGADGRSAARGSGSPRGGDADGALAAVGGDESPGAEYGPYLAGVRRRIAAALRYPPAARRRGLTGTVQIEMVIAASGAVTAAEVVASSSHALLDDAAVETVKSLGRQPFPADLRPRTLRVRLPVVFSLE